MSGFTEAERREEAKRRKAEELAREHSRAKASQYRPGPHDPSCVVCNRQFPAWQVTDDRAPICDLCF